MEYGQDNYGGRQWALPGNARQGRRPRYRLGRSERAAGVLVAAALVAVAAVTFVFALSWVRSQAAIDVVRAQVQAIHEGKIEQAYALFSSSYQSATSLPMFRRWVRRQGRLTNVRSLQFWGRSVWGTTAILRGRFEDDLGHRFAVRYILVQEEDGWRIDRFQLSLEPPDSAPPPQRFIYI